MQEISDNYFKVITNYRQRHYFLNVTYLVKKAADDFPAPSQQPDCLAQFLAQYFHILAAYIF